MPRALPTRLHRRATATLATALTVTALALLSMSTSPAVAAPAAGPVGCNYADSGSGAYADTICWVDFTGFDVTAAASSAGQPMTVTLSGGYTASFVVKSRPVAGYTDMSTCIGAGPIPYPTGAWPMGRAGYTGIAGLPGLLNNTSAACRGAGKAVDLQLTDIAVLGPDGSPVSGYGVVSTEAEVTAGTEIIKWVSDVTLTQLDEIAMPGANGTAGCVAANVSGLGTTTVTCDGNDGNIKFGTSLIAAKSPTYFNTQSFNPAILGTVYGFLPPAPVAIDDTPTTVQDEPVTFGPTANDTASGPATIDLTTVRLLDGGNPVTTLTNSDGTYTVNTTTGEITFTPTPGFTGTATPIDYRFSDSLGQNADATITITVGPIVGGSLLNGPVAMGLIGLLALVGGAFGVRRRSLESR